MTKLTGVESRMPAPTPDRALVAHGAIMTLLGLLSGFSPFFAKAPVAGLEAHTIGVLQGALLFGLAAVWPSLGRRPRGDSGPILRIDRSLCQLVGSSALGPMERKRDVHCARRFDARRRGPLDGRDGGRSAECIDPGNRHVPAHPLGALEKARRLIIATPRSSIGASSLATPLTWR